MLGNKSAPPLSSSLDSEASVETQFDYSLNDQAQEATTSEKKKFRFSPKWWHKVLFLLFVVLVAVGGAGAVIGIYTYNVVLELKSKGLEAREIGSAAYTNFKNQNLPATEAELKRVQEKLGEIRQVYSKLAFYQYIPIARAYYMDGVHGLNAGDAGMKAGLQSIQSITPYADVLGCTGEGTFTGGTTEDRLKVLLQTLEKVTPELDKITADLQIVEAEISQIDPQRYPENFRDIPVRSYVTQIQDLSKSGVAALTDYRPIIENLPKMAGNNGRKKYLILFQNDNEERPSGGFLTAYATIFVENGKVTPEKSDDIYELDKKFSKKLPIPEALGRYLTTEKKWNLRDMNTSPDFKVSMDQFLEGYKTIKSEPQDIDGIIAVDTHVLVDLIKILGPVPVEGFGTFTAENDKRSDCPNIIYELSNIITRPTPYIREDRKGVIGPLMRQTLTKFYQAPKQQWPLVFEAALGKADQLGKGGWVGGRHVQVYFFDPALQEVAEKINVAGRMTAPEKEMDFLGIVDANLGGAKSNLFVDYSVLQTVSAPENGQITKTVEVTYKNDRKADNCNLEAGLLCLNSTLRDWHRLYLPKGAKLVEAQGFTQPPKEYEEAGFSVIDSFFILEPNSQAKVKVTYTVPYAATDTYTLKMWKQGGKSPAEVTIDVNGSEEKFTFEKDTLFEAKF